MTDRFSNLIPILALALAACVDSPTTAPNKIPDLRFQWVSAFPAYEQGKILQLDAGSARLTGQRLWAPLQLTAHDSWQILDFTPADPIPELTSVAATGPIADRDATVFDLIADHGVVTSLDCTATRYAAIATTSAEAVYEGGSFDGDLAGFSSYVVSQGERGAVVTALCDDNGFLHALAFLRAGATEKLEATVATATDATLDGQVRALAAGGYTVTAFGHVRDQLVMVGTRVAGGGQPRMLDVSAEMPALSNGYAIVGWSETAVVLER